MARFSSLQMPQDNVASQVQSANDIIVQRLARQGVQQAPTKVAPVSQQIGGLAGQQAGQQQIQAAQQQAQQQVQQAQQVATQQARQQQQALAERKLNLNEQHFNNVMRLERLDSNLKNQLFDDQMAFKRDEQGRVFFNERQLADWAKTKARTVEEFKNYEQQATQTHQRRMAMLQQMHAKVTQEMQHASRKRTQKEAQRYQKWLTDTKIALEDEIRKQKQAAAQNKALWQGVGTVAGAIIGGTIGSVVPGAGTAAGAIAGASIGASAGSALAPT